MAVMMGPAKPAKRFHSSCVTLGVDYSTISRMTRHGLPAANIPSGTSRVTTLPATARDPIRTPGRMIAPPPIHTSDPCGLAFRTPGAAAVVR
jgi:hypothetical protein